MKTTNRLASFLSAVKSSASFATLVTLQLGNSVYAQPTTGFNQTGVGPFDYNDAANWVDSDGVAGATAGDINGIWDPLLSVPSSQTITFGTNTSLSTALSFQYEGSGNQTLRGTGGNFTLTLGGDILHNTVSGTRTINFGSSSSNQALNVDLGGVTRTFNVGSGRSLGFVNALSNGSIIARGGTINFSGVNTYSGTTTVTTGVVALNGSVGSSANSDFTVIANGNNSTSLQFNSSSNGNPGTTRAKSVTLNGLGGAGGAFLSVTGNGTVNSADVITNALTASGGYGIVSISAHANRNARLEADSFTRSVGSSTLIRGSDLGVSEISSLVAGDANLKFTTAPSLVGSGGSADSTTVSILKGTYGETTSGASGGTGGLVTYDTTNGIRILDTTTEYTAAIVDGQTALDNVRIVRTSGSASQNLNLVETTTTINSLSFNVSGAGTDSGVILSGDAGTTLKLNSGTIFANQTVTTPVASDKIHITVPKLDLNGGEGIVILGATNANTGAQNNINAPVQIDSEITNDGGLGLTKGGNGHLRLGGAVQSTYTGNTVLNTGVLYLDKSVVNIALPDAGTLILNGGTLLQAGNQIPDNSNVEVRGGGWAVSSSSSNGNVSSETINNFTLTAGYFRNGQSNGGVFNILGTANLSGGTFAAVGNGSNVTVTGAMSISDGATLTLGASSNASGNSRLTLNGGLNITQPVSGTYTPITISASTNAANLGGKLILASNVTFTGNGTNSETTTISAAVATGPLGTLHLDGTRTFNVGNGAADTDLTITATVTDNGANVGNLIKTGAGTMALTGQYNYTGNTTVSGGKLSLGSASLNDAGIVNVEGSAVLNLDFIGSDTVADFQIDGVSQGSGNFTSAHPSGRIIGSGSLQVGPSSDPFIAWIDSFTGLTDPGDKTKTADPDNDGLNNFAEFALNGNPDNGGDNGMSASLIQDTKAPVGNELTYIIAVRDGATFATASGGVQTATVAADKVNYTVEGSIDLVFPGSAVSHVSTANTAPGTGLPDLTGTSWEYHTFRLDASEGLTGKGFLRVITRTVP